MVTVDQLALEPEYAVEQIVERPVRLPELHRRHEYFQIKNGVERLAGALLLIPASPVILACWLAVRLTSKGPGFFKQTRVGLGGQLFDVYKLRTMRQDAEADGPQWSVKGDSRITRLGRIFRTLHLDELPQLINVVKGEMVLVGPRPERPEFVGILSEEIPGYRRRLWVKPGITGLAQINLPPDCGLRCVERKQVLDLHHIDTANAWLDTRMVLVTALRLCCISNDRLVRTLGLDRKDLLKDCPPLAPNQKPTKLTDLLEQRKYRNEWAIDPPHAAHATPHLPK